jgi:hypothetical protein
MVSRRLTLSRIGVGCRESSAFLGAAIALMFAPERGDKTRRRLRRRLQRLREETTEGLERAGTRTRRDLERRKRRLEAGLERAADRARDAI